MSVSTLIFDAPLSLIRLTLASASAAAEDDDDTPKPSAAALAAAALLAGENDEDDDEDDEDEEGVMVKILAYVFIGDAYAACNEALLKEVCDCARVYFSHVLDSCESPCIAWLAQLGSLRCLPCL